MTIPMRCCQFRLFPALFLAALFLCSIHSLALGAEGSITQSPALVRGPYLQQLTPNSVVIRWRTDVPSKSRVTYGTSLSYGGMATDTNLTTEHIVKLGGLISSRKYYYTIGTTTHILAGDSSFYFITSPSESSDAPVRFWATGDFGIGSQSQAAVRDAMQAYTGNIPVNLWVWLGDNAYWTGTDQQYQSFVFDMYPKQLRCIPLYPAPGNHDYGNEGYQSQTTLTTNFPYFNIFTVPSQGEAGGVPSFSSKYYSYNYGDIHFLSLDSYGTANDSTSNMYQWIESDLKVNTKKWLIAYFHHPPYSKGTHNSDTEQELIDMRTNIVPLLEKYGVDLVLSGHSHNNERSYFMHGHYENSVTFSESMKVSTDSRYFKKDSSGKGTVYAVCGTSGQDPGSFQSDAPMPCMYFNNNTDNCSMVIDIQGDFLSAKYLTKNQTVVDHFTIVKSLAASGSAFTFSIQQTPGNPIAVMSFTLPHSSDIGLEFYSLSGQLTYQIPSFQKNLAPGIHLAELNKDSLGLASGIYIVKAIFGDKTESAKLTIP